jgi:hypothetical protein
MRSHAEPRELVERGLRLMVVAALAWCLIRALTHRADAVERARSATLQRALARWSTVAAPSAVELGLDRPPPGVEREWLAALAGAGTAVRWTGDSLLPTALAVVPVADPAGGVEAGIAAPDGRVAILADAAGALDSAPVRGSGLRFHLADARGAVEARVGAVPAVGTALDSLVLRRLLVVGRAGWEMKFVVAALAERGWAVDAHHVVSPKSDVVQGTLRAVATQPGTGPSPAPPAGMMLGRGMVSGTMRFGPPGAGDAPAPTPSPPRSASPRALVEIDTAKYAAVLAIDSSAARYAATIGRYVRRGGGLLLWAEAGRSPALAALGAGTGFGDPLEGVEEWPVGGTPRVALDMAPVLGLRSDAVVIERRGPHVAVAARRIDAGRSLTLGYLETWRWRMAGTGDAPAEHRAWLARLVAGVAYSPRSPIPTAALDPAPLAGLVSRLGPPAEPGAGGAGGGWDWLSSRWLFALIGIGLLVEWASRRLRGVR